MKLKLTDNTKLVLLQIGYAIALTTFIASLIGLVLISLEKAEKGGGLKSEVDKVWNGTNSPTK